MMYLKKKCAMYHISSQKMEVSFNRRIGSGRMHRNASYNGMIVVMILMIFMSSIQSTHGNMLIRAFVDSYVNNHEHETSLDFVKGMSSAFLTLSSSYRNPSRMLTDASKHQFVRTRMHVRDGDDDASGGDEYPGTEFYDPETGKMGATEKCDESNVDVFEDCVYKPAQPDTSDQETPP